MAAVTSIRVAARASRVAARRSPPTSGTQLCWTRRPASAVRAGVSFSTSASKRTVHDPHSEETFEEFSARYENEFNAVQDVFDLQRNLNNAFAYDLVPSPSVVTAALRAARRVNDFPTAVRIFEGLKEKVENKGQYEEYLKELEPVREELGVSLKEWMFPEADH